MPANLRNPNKGSAAAEKEESAYLCQLFPAALRIPAKLSAAAAARAFNPSALGSGSGVDRSAAAGVRDKARSTMLSNMGISESAGSG